MSGITFGFNGNNGKESSSKNNPATQFGAEIDEFMAAGHFGNKSRTCRDYVESRI